MRRASAKCLNAVVSTRHHMLSDLYKRLVVKEIIVHDPVISTWDDWLGFILGFTFILDLVRLFNFFWYLVCLFISTCGKYFSAIKKCYVAIMCTIWLKKTNQLLVLCQYR